MSKLKASEVEQAIRDRRIIQARRSGKSIDDIADDFDLTPQTISRVINTRLAQTIRLRDTEVDLLRQQELERLDAVQQAAWPAAMDGHIDSLKIVMNAVDRRCKLLGLDAPQQLEVISIGAIEAEMRRIDQQLALGDRPEWVDGELVEDDEVSRELPGSTYNPDRAVPGGTEARRG